MAERELQRVVQITFDAYQEKALETKMYAVEDAIVYPALSGCGEMGEIANKVKKWMRGGRKQEELITLRAQLKDEAGDVLWYLASLLDDVDVSLGECAVENLIKVHARKAAGTTHGHAEDSKGA